MSDKNLAAEVRRLNEIIKATIRQRDLALAAQVNAEVNAALIQDSLRDVQAARTAANTTIAEMKSELEKLKATNGTENASSE